MATLDKYKLQRLTWDSDKDLGGFAEWVDQFSSVVRSTEHGYILEEYLDVKLERNKATEMAIPSFLLKDPDF